MKHAKRERDNFRGRLETDAERLRFDAFMKAARPLSASQTGFVVHSFTSGVSWIGSPKGLIAQRYATEHYDFRDGVLDALCKASEAAVTERLKAALEKTKQQEAKAAEAAARPEKVAQAREMWSLPLRLTLSAEDGGVIDTRKFYSLDGFDAARHDLRWQAEKAAMLDPTDPRDEEPK